MIFSSYKRKKILNGKNEGFNCVESKGYGGGASGREKTFCPSWRGSNPKIDLGFLGTELLSIYYSWAYFFFLKCVINSFMPSCSAGGLGLIPSSSNIQMFFSLLT